MEKKSIKEIKIEEANAIIEALENFHKDPNSKEWNKECSQKVAMPKSATDDVYRGSNFVRLLGKRYGSSNWLSWNKIQELSKIDKTIHVKKGEKASRVVYFQMVEFKTGDMVESDGELIDGVKKYPMLKYTNVFNVEQINNKEEVLKLIKAKDIPEVTTDGQLKSNDYINAVYEVASELGIYIDHQNIDRAFYNSGTDKIVLPPVESFDNERAYANTLLHEIVHATGHSSRLNREGIGQGGFGSYSYAYEELIAETGSMLLSARTGLQYEPLAHDNHLAYLTSWKNAMRNEPEKASKELLRAIGEAQKAFDYLDEKVQEKLTLKAESKLQVDSQLEEIKNAQQAKNSEEFKSRKVSGSPRL